MKKIIFLLLLPLFAQAQSYNDTYLAQEADTIRLETLAGRNSAKRVGRMAKNLVQNKLNLGGGTLTGRLIVNISNSNLIQGSGNTTSNLATEIVLSRSGTASLSYGFGPNLTLSNSTSNKSILIQSSDDNLQIFNSTGAEVQRINPSGVLMVGNLLSTAGTVADASILGFKSYTSTSNNSVFHINGFFQSEQTAATTQSIQGVEGYTKVSHVGGTTALAIGTIGNVELATNATLSQATALGGGVVLNGTGTVTSGWGVGTLSAVTNSGTIAELHYFHGGSTISGGGAITKGVGLYIETFPSGTTGKWNIITNDTGGTQLFHGFLIMPDLPSSAAGLITGSIWQDPADSHRLKWVP